MRNGSAGQESDKGQTSGRVDVIVPVLNEREMIPGFLRRIDALGLPLNLIFVDNGSTDGTIEYLRLRPETKLIVHGKNLGYGRSLVDGMKASTTDMVIIIDADCEYPPEAIPAVIDALKAAPVVYASRFLGGGKVDMSLTRKWGNRFLTALFNLIYAQKLTDLYTGMKGMRRQAFEGLTWNRSGFEHVAEFAAKIALRGLKIMEIPVIYTPRQTGKSKMHHVPELIKAMACLFYFRVDRNA
jgi:glycosyltransferase involved in cell wall biosynthesis